MITRLEPNPANLCFGCGGANARGMRLVFERDDERRTIRGQFRIGEEFSGGAGFIHGGIIALLLDEAMGKLNRFSDVRAPTAELTIDYLKPVLVDTDITVEAFEVERKGRQLFHRAEIRNSAGEILARGRGRFVAVSRDWSPAGKQTEQK